MAEDQTPLSGDDKPHADNSAGVEIELREEGESTATTLTRTAVGDALTPVSVTRRRKSRHRAVPLMPEVRHWAATGLEVRSARNTDEIVIAGTPIVYDTPYAVRDLFGEFEERMARGVASDVLSSGADVRFLFNHDGLPLARSTAGTLVLRDGDASLDFEARLDARQQLANDLAIAIERGDVSQMSCGFIVARDEWEEDMEHRTILAFADLLDVSAVTYPASPTTSIDIAQRMALEIPVESRARVRHMIADVTAGKSLSREQVSVLRAALLDPGEDLDTPEGTGRLGAPDGNGDTWSEPGSGNATPSDGVVDAGTTDGGAAGIQDGTGSRSADEAVETTDAEPAETVEQSAPKTSRATRLRVKRAARGV